MKNISGNPYLTSDSDGIFIDSVSFSEIVKQFKTPLLIFLENRIRENIKTFIDVFSSEFENFQCFYSFKKSEHTFKGDYRIYKGETFC